MQTRLLLCLCVFGIVLAEDDRPPRQVHFGLLQNGTFYNRQHEVSVLPRKISKVFPNSKSFVKSSTVTSARANLITEPIVVSDGTEGKDDVSIPVPVTFLNNDTESTLQSRSTNSVQILKPNNTIPVPVLVKPPPNVFLPVASTPRPFVPSPVQKEATTSDSYLQNPFSVVSSSFRLWPKLPEPVPVPVLASKSFAKKFHEKSSAYVGPQYHPKPFIPVTNPAQNRYHQNPVPVQYPVNSQPQAQLGQPPNQGPIFFVIPGSNNGQPIPGGNQAPTPIQSQSQPQTGNQNYIILQSPFGDNSQSSVPYQASQNNGYSSSQGYSVNQQQAPSNYPVLASPNALGGLQAQFSQQAQSGQQAPLNYILLGPSNAAGSQVQAVDQQTALKNAIFGAAGASRTQVNLGGQIPAAGFSPFAPQNVPGNTVNTGNPAGQAPLNFAVLAPSNLPANSQGGQSAINYPVFGAPNTQGNQPQYASQSPQNFAFPSSQVPAQPNSQPTLTGLQISPNAGSGFSSSTPYPNVGSSLTQYSFTAQSPPSQYEGFSAAAPTAQPNYYQPTASPQYFGVSSTPAPSAQPNYYQPTSSPQYFGASSTPAPSYYQSAPPSQFTGFPSAPTATAQPNFYQPTSAPQDNLSPNAQSNFYQTTSLPQNFGYPSSPSPTASPSFSSSPTSQVRFSGSGGSYSYFV